MNTLEVEHKKEEFRNYLLYSKKLPDMGVITFASLLTSNRSKRALAKKDGVFTIQDVIAVLSNLQPNTMFFKGDRVRGNVENHLFDKRPFGFIQKCNVQFYLWKMHRPISKSRDEIKNLDPLCILQREGNGKYSFIKNAQTTVEKEMRKKRSVLERSRIREAEISI